MYTQSATTFAYFFSHIDFTSKSAINNQKLLETDTVNAALHPVLLALFLCGCFSPAWVAPCFEFSQNMSKTDNDPTVAVAVSTQVKLCPYNEEEPAIWFRLIKAQFATAGIKSQKLRYADALASLPKQVLQDILDTVL